jgi:pyruvate dehydrogenase E2 component (dihydrolipoamide acetyltransferase)
MATEVNLPELGESVTEGTVTRWLKQVGDEVAVDEPLLEVSTDKVDTEIPSPVAGTLLEIRANEDDTVEVGAVLAVIGAADESSGGQEPAPAEPEQAEQEQAEEAPAEPERAEEEQAGEEQAGESTPLEEENAEREAAHAQAEEADTPDETAAAEEPAQEEPAEEPAQQAPAASSGSSTGGGEQTVVRLPELGESVTEGTVTRWLKQVGDQVAADESLLEVSTDKVDTEIPSPAAGTLLEIKVNEDETVEVGAELAVIGSGEPAPSGSTSGGDQPEAAA